jgi:signal transduction histidine kinase
VSRILLLLEPPQNRHLLANWLATHHEVVTAESDRALQDPFDLGLIDGPTLSRLWEAVQARRKAEEPVFLPVLLLTARQGVDLATRHLWRSIDEVVLRPVEKVELQARVEVLLRARRLSLELKRRNEDLGTFTHAMSHELRAPLRLIGAFGQTLVEDPTSTLSERAKRALGHIQASITQMQELITSLLAFGRVGRGRVRLRTVDLQAVVGRCLQELEPDIRACHAHIAVIGDLPSIRADASLLKLALTNLLVNALKFVPPGECPHVTLTATTTPTGWRIAVQDRGIGIAPDQHQRIFRPFVRLHGMEDYPGSGLGLAIVAKAVDLMGGCVGVDTTPGHGSTFWMELSSMREGDEILTSR